MFVSAANPLAAMEAVKRTDTLKVEQMCQSFFQRIVCEKGLE
jgi:hypothetical protein